MKLSATAKLVLGLVAILGLLVFGVIVDLGVYAGRIHRGVHVQDLDLGGRTVEEAAEILAGRGEEMRTEPIVLTAPGFDCNFYPYEVGWRPHPAATADDAYAVGRVGGVVTALSDRVRGWLGTIEVAWSESRRPHRMRQTLDRCEERAASVGAVVRRPKLRLRIERAIPRWPRPFSFDVPLQPEEG
ncbi:MAG: hypothetical protein M3345_00835 [Actinomycetota bacterium]|nr:hypothetical protein [Actinomycetota bacterium]